MNGSTYEDNGGTIKASPFSAPTEMQKRWLSWNILSGARAIATRQYGVKHSYAGTVTDLEIAKRRRKNKVAKASRKANRGN